MWTVRQFLLDDLRRTTVLEVRYGGWPFEMPKGFPGETIQGFRFSEVLREFKGYWHNCWAIRHLIDSPINSPTLYVKRRVDLEYWQKRELLAEPILFVWEEDKEKPKKTCS